MPTLKKSSQTKNRTFPLKKLEKEEQSKPKANRRKEITETNENRETTEKINKTKSFF